MFYPKNDHFFSIHSVKHAIIAYAEPKKLQFFTLYASDVNFWSGLEWVLAEELDVLEDFPLDFSFQF